MNKKGFVFFYTLMVGICIIILGISFAPAIKQVADDARNDSYLNCTGTVTDDFNQATCWYIDTTKLMIAGGIILIGIAVIGAKVVFS